MAVLVPTITLYANDCMIGIGDSGAPPALAGDVLLFSDIVALLDSSGYGWTTTRARYAATYATNKDAESAFDNNGGVFTIEKDRLVVINDGIASDVVYAIPRLTVVRQTQRAATLRFQNPQVTEGVFDANTSKFNVALIADSLSVDCDLKALLGASYPTLPDLVQAFGDNCITYGVGMGAVPNLQPTQRTYADGSLRLVLYLQAYLPLITGYGYLTIDMGWSGAR